MPVMGNGTEIEALKKTARKSQGNRRYFLGDVWTGEGGTCRPTGELRI